MTRLVRPYGDLSARAAQARVPTYRDFTGAPIEWARKSPLIVLRIGLMGIGQLGAATAMASSAARSQHAAWMSFWTHAGQAAAGKTLVECVQFALLGVWPPAENAQLCLIAALAPVVLFLIRAGSLWRSGSLTRAPNASGCETVVLVVSLALWFGCATAPSYTGSPR